MMLALQKEVEESGLEPGLLDLVEMRASQVNACAYRADSLARSDYSRPFEASGR